VLDLRIEYCLGLSNGFRRYRPHKELLPILREWLADPRRLGALGRVTVVDGFDPVLAEEKKARQKARSKTKGISSEGGPSKPSKSDKAKAEAEKRSLGKYAAKIEQAREEAMETVGKDVTHGKSGSGGPRMAMARSGSSASSISGRVLGRSRSSSVSSEEIEGALQEASSKSGAGGEAS
jgi:hypothetical protein